MRLLFSLLLTLPLLTLNSARATPPDAALLLGKMTKALRSKVGLELTFELTAANNSGAVNGALRGEVAAQGNSYRVINEEMEIYCNGESKWILNRATAELTIFYNDTSQVELIENPIGFLTSLSRANSQFNHPKRAVEIVHPKEERELWQIELTPKSKYAAYKCLLLAIDKRSSLPALIRYTSKDESSYTILISELKLNESGWSESYFTPPSHYLKGDKITVIDLR